MGLKKYILFSILFIIGVALLVYSVESGDYELMVMEYTFKLPIVCWVLLPVILLFGATLLHLSFYGVKLYFFNRCVYKDELNMLEVIKNNLLNRDVVKSFNRVAFKEFYQILSQVKLLPKEGSFESSNEEIRSIIDKVKAINNGEYISLKELKLDNLNPLVIQNETNRITQDESYCLEILKRPSAHAFDNIKKAYFIVLESKSMTTIKKLLPQIKLDKSMVIALLKRDAQQTDFSLDQEEIIRYIGMVDYSKKDFIECAKLYKERMLPDDLLALFEKLSNDNELAMAAYLYLLLEYEMLEQIREIFDSSSLDEWVPYRVILELKDSGKSYSLDSLCYC